MINQSLRILMVAWAGSLWFAGFFAAPVLFSSIDNRMLAGDIAGQFFAAVNWAGLVIVALIFIRQCKQVERLFRDWGMIALMVIWLILVVLLCVITPEMQSIKEITEWRLNPELSARFGMFHGLSSVLYMLNSALVLFLIVQGRVLFFKKA